MNPAVARAGASSAATTVSSPTLARQRSGRCHRARDRVRGAIPPVRRGSWPVTCAPSCGAPRWTLPAPVVWRTPRRRSSTRCRRWSTAMARRPWRSPRSWYGPAGELLDDALVPICVSRQVLGGVAPGGRWDCRAAGRPLACSWQRWSDTNCSRSPPPSSRFACLVSASVAGIFTRSSRGRVGRSRRTRRRHPHERVEPPPCDISRVTEYRRIGKYLQGEHHLRDARRLQFL